MKAELQPLEGKYYGTVISLMNNGVEIGTIPLWLSEDMTPSDRELEGYGFTRSDWDQNILVEFNGENVPIKSEYFCYDNHFETQQTYELALCIIAAINNKNRRE